MRTRLKVCCISSPAEAELAIHHGADALGLVGDMPSGPGIIDGELARAIARQVPPPVETFLLTSCATAGEIVDHVAYCGTTTVQVVRHVDPAAHEIIRGRLPTIRRVQVLHVEDDSILELAAEYEPYVHAFLLDSGRPKADVVELGGTGRVHDWVLSAALVAQTHRPVFLAGGLTPENVGAAVGSVTPFGVDLCSGVRTEGALDEAKLGRFVNSLGNAGRARPTWRFV